MAKIKGTMKDGEANWEPRDIGYNIKAKDEKGHFERPTIRFRPDAWDSVTLICNERIFPECKNNHDIVRLAVERLRKDVFSGDLPLASEDILEIREAIRHVEKYAAKQLKYQILEEQVEHLFSQAKSFNKAGDLLSEFLEKLSTENKRYIRNFAFKNKTKLKGLLGKSKMDEETDRGMDHLIDPNEAGFQ